MGGGLPSPSDPGRNRYQGLQIWGCDGKDGCCGLCLGGGWPLAFSSDLVTERWWVPSCCLSPFFLQELINKAINAALAARKEWDLKPVRDRAQIFLKAADMLSGPRRAEVLAKTMIGQVRGMRD